MAHISTETSDVELIHQLRAGHQDALTVLYGRYGSLVYTVALKLLKQPTDAEDLTQEIFLNFWKQDKFDPSRAALSTYLCVIARTRALNRISSHSSRQRSLQRLQHSALDRTSVTPLETASQTEQRETLQKALTQLPAQHRQILELNFYQGLSHADIAKQLQMPLGTVKTRARQGLTQLRQQLGDAVT